MIRLIRWLLPSQVTDRQLNNDFYAGDLAYLSLVHTKPVMTDLHRTNTDRWSGSCYE